MKVVFHNGIDDRTVEYLLRAECLECGGPTKTDGWGCCYHCGSDIVFRVEVVKVVRCSAQPKICGKAPRMIIVDDLDAP